MNSMHLAVNTVGAAVVGVALTCVLPKAGAADPGLKFEGGPWIPALAIVSSAANPGGAERGDGADVSSYAAVLSFAVEPEALGESAAALQSTLAAAGSGPVAIRAQVSIEPAPGEADAPEAEWVPAVLVIAQADGDPPAPPSSASPGQQLEERQAGGRDETSRWVPAIAVTNGLLVQSTQANVESAFLPSSEEVRPSTDGSLSMLDPWMNASLELMTPSPVDVPGLPRLFLHGDVGMNFGFGRDVAKEGNPGGELKNPAPGRPISSPNVIQGQGSTTNAEPKTLQLGAGAGIAFTLDAMGRRFRIKPSVEYFQETLEISGVMKSQTILDGGEVILNGPGPGDDVVVPATLNPPTVLRGSQSKTYHGLGGGLEIEADTRRAGPLVMTLFVSGQAYRILGDRTVEFTATGEAVTLDPAIYGTSGPEVPTASWSFTKDAWSYQGVVGMRFRWLPD